MCIMPEVWGERRGSHLLLAHPVCKRSSSCSSACCVQVGADEKLSSVIDGESLVNDGSALVIFLVLQQFVQGASLSVGQVGAGWLAG